LTGGGIGAALTAVPGSSAVYKGGIVSYTNEIKMNLLGVTAVLLDTYGAVSAPVAEEMAAGVRRLLNSDIAVSVTGLAGPAGDEFSHPVGTVFIGYQDSCHTIVEHHCFEGNREEIRSQTIQAALQLILQYNS
jgi:PncC family amidohydrolase